MANVMANIVSFSGLLAKLNQSKGKKDDPALYETIKGILQTGDQNQNVTNENITVITNGTDGPIITYDIAVGLANSRKLVAGSNIVLDLSVGGKIVISASGGGSDDLAFFMGS